MEWTDEAIVIGARRHGESAVILEAMTPARGRHLGLVRGGRSTKLQPVLQPGNSVRLTWRARLEEHLGHFTVEGVKSRIASWMDDRRALAAIAYLSALARLLPERDPHPAIYHSMNAIFDRLDDARQSSAMMARFEMTFLQELGFGIDLAECAATGAREDLIYVSPKSGRAVSRAAGEPYRERLLALPAFIANDRTNAPPDAAALNDAFRLTRHFLLRDVFEPRGLSLPHEREILIEAVARSEAGAPAEEALALS